MVRAALATLAMLALHTPSLSVAVEPSSGSAVDVLTVLCGTAAAESVGGMLDSLLFHRSVPLRLHIVADEAARRALPNPRPPRTASGGAVALVQTQYTEAEDALSSLSSLPELADTPVGCSALPLFAAHLLPTAQRAIVLAPEVIVLADIADLWQYFAHLEASAAYIGAVVDQSSWYTDHPEWAGAQGDSVNGAVLLLDLRAMRAVDWSGLVKQAKALGEDAKVGLRSVRHKMIDGIKKEVKDGYSEDMGKDQEANVESMVKQYTESIGTLVAAKEVDILTI